MRESKLFRYAGEVDLGRDRLGPLLFRLALPAVTSQVVNLLYNLVDRMYIGHIEKVGALALTGLGVAFPIIMVISAFAALLAFGCAPLASIAMGRGQKDEPERILGTSVVGLVGVALLLTFGISLAKRELLILFGASETTLPYGVQYLQIYVLGSVFVCLSLGLNAFIAAQGFSVVSMRTVLIGAVANVILDPILIYGCAMGVAGAALASVISQALSAVFALWFLCGPRTKWRIRRKWLRFDWSRLGPGVALGLSPFLMMSTESILSLAFYSSLQRYGGDLAVGTMTIVSSVMQFGFLPLQGLTQGGQPILSYNYGKGDGERVRGAFRLQLLCCMVFSLVLWLLIQLAPKFFLGLFTQEEALLSFGVPKLRLYTAALFLFGAQVACQQAFIAFGNAKTSAFLALYRKMILLIPLILLLPLVFEDRVKAVFLAEPVADVIAVVTTLVLFWRYFKQLQKKMSEPALRQDEKGK